MQELSKADIAQEIHAKAIGYYKQSEQFGYKFLMELKKIRDDRLFTELGFKDFDQYTQQSFNYTRRTIDKRISAAETFGNDFENARSQLGDRKVQQIAQLPYDQREEVMQDGIDTEQGHKSVDEATTREIEEYKRKLKQSEEANKTLDGILSENAETISALEQQVKNKPKPEVVEKTVTKEVKPDDYEQLKQQAQTVSSLRNKNSELQGEIDKLNGKLSEMNSKGQKYEELQQKIKNLEYKKSGVMKSIDSGAEIISMNKKLKKMFDGEISSVRYRNFFADDPDNSIVDETRELIDTLQAFVDDMNGVLPTNDRKIIEGKFTE